MPAYDMEAHFHRGRKEVTFLLGEVEYRQRASLGVMIRLEEKLGPATTLLGRLSTRNATVKELQSLIALILRDHAELPRGDALLEAIEAVGLWETMAAAAAFVTYGMSSDMPPSGEPAGN